MLDLKNLSSEINLKIQQVKDRETLESLKTLYLGKKVSLQKHSKVWARLMLMKERILHQN